MNDHEISEADVNSLASKLADFCDSLAPGERAAFEYVEQYLAAVASDDATDIESYVFIVEDETAGDLGVASFEESTASAAATLAQDDRATLWRTVLGNLISA